MNLSCLGIDIAKVKFNVCLLLLTGKLKHKVFPNNAAGFAELQEWLKKHQDRQTGAWPAVSMNKVYPAGSMEEKFLQDAATAFAALALTS